MGSVPVRVPLSLAGGPTTGPPRSFEQGLISRPSWPSCSRPTREAYVI
jgi:hypothetical protein